MYLEVYVSICYGLSVSFGFKVVAETFLEHYRDIGRSAFVFCTSPTFSTSVSPLRSRGRTPCKLRAFVELVENADLKSPYRRIISFLTLCAITRRTEAKYASYDDIFAGS